MSIGNFSVSLAVKDLQASKKFYLSLGFSVFHGAEEQGWLILQCGNATIGLFQGMFEGNILTFNPGWDQNAQPVDDFEDVRSIQKRLKAEGITLANEVDESGSGAGSFMLSDPDGNTILFDQHV